MEPKANNLRWYDASRSVPDNAKRPIEAGKLKGKTNINAQWRLKQLTEMFGPIGFGWKITTTEHWTSEAAGEICANVKINLFIKDPESGQWSDAIEGVGGSKLCGKGQGDGINDEAWKMATTDAISVACKMIGFGADVYWAEDRTKYDVQPTQPVRPVQQYQQVQTKQPVQLTQELWDRYIKAAAAGRPCQSGCTAREGFIRTFDPDKNLLMKFDNDVQSLINHSNAS